MAVIAGTVEQPEPDMPHVRTVSRDALHAHLIWKAWLRTEERPPRGASPNGAPTNGDAGKSRHVIPADERKRLHKRLGSLEIRGLVGFNPDKVWSTAPVRLL
jgi:hypothetical protein